MYRYSVLSLLLMFGVAIYSASPQQIDDAWIMVPWTQGGHYYHNTLTREDQDYHPSCLSKNCKWTKKD